MQALMACDGADVNKVEFVDVSFAILRRYPGRGGLHLDLLCLDGIEAEVRGMPINVIWLEDSQCVPDYYPHRHHQRNLLPRTPIWCALRGGRPGYQYAVTTQSRRDLTATRSRRRAGARSQVWLSPAMPMTLPAGASSNWP